MIMHFLYVQFNVSDLSLEDGCLAIHQRVEIVKGWNGELGHAGNVVLKVRSQHVSWLE